MTSSPRRRAATTASTQPPTVQATHRSALGESRGADTDVVDDGARATPRVSRGSIIVPAHNEAARMTPFLEALSDVATRYGVLVVVVCNGCSDDTAALARRYAGITVVETDRASKCHALNLGDAAAADNFPRLYCDADSVTDASSLHELLEALRVDRPLAVRPASRQRFATSSRAVKVAASLPDLVPALRAAGRVHLEGNAIYGTNAAGRARFGEFPEVIADDAFFDRMFPAEHKAVVDAACVTIDEPADLATYFRILVRVCQGNRQLNDWLAQNVTTSAVAPGSAPLVAKLAKLRGIRLRDWPAVTFGVGIRIAAQMEAVRRRRMRRVTSWK